MHRENCLESSSGRISSDELVSGGRVVGRAVCCLDSIDSTNNEAKRLAAAGGSDGLVVIAEEQTCGRGRLGRSFESVKGMGLYFSVLLRPKLLPAEVTGITGCAAVAVCEAIEAACGARSVIKWPNDILLGGKKLCGILTELNINSESGALDYIIIGIGINVGHQASDFSESIASIATSLAQELGYAPQRATLAQALISALDDMYASFPSKRDEYLTRYRNLCITPGHEITFQYNGVATRAFAESVGSDYGLVARLTDGTTHVIYTGEVL